LRRTPGSASLRSASAAVRDPGRACGAPTYRIAREDFMSFETHTDDFIQAIGENELDLVSGGDILNDIYKGIKDFVHGLVDGYNNQ
jgi:hypothetical protein